jgi:hypothetical protein
MSVGNISKREKDDGLRIIFYINCSMILTRYTELNLILTLLLINFKLLKKKIILKYIYIYMYILIKFI